MLSVQQVMQRPIRDGLLQFYRNARWGTCGDCPRDSNGVAYPEFCKQTERSDHHLTIDDLNHQINLNIRQ